MTPLVDGLSALWDHKGFLLSLVAVFAGLPALGNYARKKKWIP